MKKLIVLCVLFIVQITLAQKAELVIPSNHAVPIGNIKVTPDGKYIITSSRDDNRKIWEASTMKVIKDLKLPAGKYVFSKDGKSLLISASEPKKLDLTTFQVTPLSMASFGNEIDSNSRYTYSNSAKFKANTMEVYRFDLQTQNEETLLTIPQKNELPLGSSKRRAILSPNSKILAVPQVWSNTVHLIKLADLSMTEIELQSELYWLTDNIILGFEFNQDFTSYKITAKDLTGKTLWTEDKTNQTKDNIVSSLIYIDTSLGMFWFFRDDSLFQGDSKGNIEMVATHKLKFPTTLTRLDSDRLIFPDSENQHLYTYSISSQQIEKITNNPAVVTPTEIKASTNDFKLFISNINGNSAVVQLDPKQLKVFDIRNNVKTQHIAIDNFGKNILTQVLNSNSYYYGSKVADYQLIKLRSIGYGGDQIVFSKDGNLIGLNDHGSPTVYSLSTKSVLFSKKSSRRFSDTGINIAISPDNKKVVYLETGLKTENGKEVPNQYIRCFDIASKTELWSFASDSHNIYFSNDGTKVIVINSYPLDVAYYNAQTGAKLNSVGSSTLNGSIADNVFNSDQSLLAFASFDSRDIHIFDPKAGRLLRTLKGSETVISGLTFLKDDFLVSTGFDSKLLIWDAVTGRKLARLIVLQDTGDWVLLAEDGRFDASQGALSKMYYNIGAKTVSLEQLYEGFYTPSLLAQLMDREANPRPQPIEIDDITLPPVVNINYKAGTRNLTVEDDEAIKTMSVDAEGAVITVNAKSNDSDVAEIRLYHNGKLISNNTRNLTVEDDTASELNKIYNVNLVEGSNSFKAVALNTQRTESLPAELILNYKPKVVVQTTQGLQLHLVVIGINSYKNPKYNLNYATADAVSFKQSIEKGMKGITTKTNVYFIKDTEADRKTILNTFEKIKQTANPQDVFVFYYAGHGVMSEGDKKDFYLVPYDVTQLYGNDGALKQKGISASELKALASQILAQKQLYILDACQSAGALSTIAVRGASEEKAIAQLARSTGTHWLTASGSEQFATEFDELGHGVFTYVVLEALSGKADSGDGRVTVNELKAYIESQVPELSAKYKGSPQYPSSFGFGQDFPVSVKN